MLSTHLVEVRAPICSHSADDAGPQRAPKPTGGLGLCRKSRPSPTINGAEGASPEKVLCSSVASRIAPNLSAAEDRASVLQHAQDLEAEAAALEAQANAMQALG